MVRRSTGSRSRVAVGLLIITGWALFAFAGAYLWTVVPIIAGSVVIAAAIRPPAVRRPQRALDLALVACLLVTAAQLIPLSPHARGVLSPSAAVIDGALLLVPPANGPDAAGRPVSLDPASTAWALAFGVALLLIFWSARAIFARGGSLRLVCRWTGWFGLALAAVMFVQRAVTPGLIYGFWRPITRTPRPAPLGPFVNRNDIATWLMMACPLVFGYAIMRLDSRSHGHGAPDIESLADARTLWLGMSVCLMMAALLASLSRSGLFGGAAAVLVFTALARRRFSERKLGWVLVATVGLTVIAMTYANLSALMERIDNTLPSNLGGRLAVWRETWPMARDFPLTGIGVGAFERGMTVYQQSTRLIFFNHAHDEYLQLLVEGGLLLAVPAGLAILAGWWGVRQRINADRTPVFWIRVGAASGLAAVAAQSVWDTGLRMPASAVLFAVAAAAALHEAETVAPAEREGRHRHKERHRQHAV
jgi:O-antigen ligase